MVRVRDYHRKDKWVRGIMNKKCGPLTYHVTVSKGLWKRHIDQLSSRVNSSNLPLTQLELTAATDGHDYLVDTISSLNETNDNASGLTYEAPQQQSVQDKSRPTVELVTPTQVEEETHLRRPSRVRHQIG
ncbi:hypothetical protein LSAT2_022597 [Lamellibrachia satsuma]|nr:hypothetical protein LSAT2_022597 [Lamellibrachia satsuma]